MKRLRLIMAVAATFACFNFTFAANPQKATPETIAASMVSELDKDVALTDSQKVIIFSRAKLFVIGVQNVNASTKSNVVENIESKKVLAFDYAMVLDSTLSIKQKEQLQLKRDERKQAAINKYTKK